MRKFIAAIDQGTSGTRCVIFDKNGRIISFSYKKHEQITPHPGWVEQNPLEILENTRFVLKDSLRKAKLNDTDIVLGVANQRETVVAWDKITGKPLHNAIVWQDSRTYDYVKELKDKGYEEEIWKKTGLHLTTYFSATKIKWLIDNVQKVREGLKEDRVLFGNMDSWLIWNLSNNHEFITDHTNASRTMLMNLNKAKWDSSLLNLFGIPINSLPNITSSINPNGGQIKFGGIELHADMGDQQASLFGSFGFNPGNLEITYGTGSFLLQNIGDKYTLNGKGLITTCAYSMDNKCTYAYEGSNAISGELLSWSRDNLKIINSLDEARLILKRNLNKLRSVYFVPAFSGLFAPYWDQSARGMIIGLTESTNKEDIILSIYDAICYQIKDTIEAMGSRDIKHIVVGGGPTENDYLMQLQANILGIKIIRSKIKEMTAFGTAIASGLGAGLFKDLGEIKRINILGKEFLPKWSEKERKMNYSDWLNAVNKARGWIES